MKKLMKCGSCGAYAMGEKCPKCGGKTKTAHPPRYSPEDKWAKYRREAKFGK